MPKLIILFVMGGCQGLLGWYMVKSGLVNDPHVSQYRLTAHLGVAVAIYAYMLWVALDLLFPTGDRRERQAGPYGRWSLALVALVYLMILSGGLVAGTRAGYAYSTWPLMGPSFIPDGLYSLTPAWLSIFEDITTIQFNHRMFAYLLFLLISALAVLVYRTGVQGRIRTGLVLMIVALLGQVTLGISTLLLHIPVSLAVAHQCGAVILLSAVLFVSHALARP